MTLDPFFASRFAKVAGTTWADVYSGDPDAVSRALEYGAPTGHYVTPASISARDTDVHGPHGPVPVRVYAPAGTRDGGPCLVWMHGGAFQFGDLDMLEAHGVAAEVARRWPGTVVSVDYRLAPKFRYPVPVDDCVAVVHSVASGPDAFAVDARRIAVGGASAGANLATATALRLRDEGGQALEAVCLAYPALHRDIPEPSVEIRAATAMLPPLARFDRAARRHIYSTYLGDLYDDPPPYGTPAIAELAGLPPFAIANAQHDDLRPSGEDFVSLLRAHGVPVDAWTEPGMAHGYLNHVGDVVGAERTIDRFVAHLRANVI